MSTPHKAGRAKPVTLAKSASGTPEPVASSKSTPKAAKVSAEKSIAAKPVQPKSTPPKAMPPVVEATPVKADVVEAAPVPVENAPASGLAETAMPAAWNELVKAQSEAALAWWHDAKDARTFADALAVNARHSRVQFDIVAGQAREMAAYFQKAFETNSERFRSLFDERKS